MTTKHPAFREEREWRIISMHSDIDHDVRLKDQIEMIGGVPQVIRKLSLDHENGMTPRLSLKNHLERVIIGPCDFPHVVRRALENALAGLGFESPEAMVSVTDIPLRLNK